MGSFRPDPNLLKKYPNAVTVPQLQARDRFVGALLGAAVGEALGAQVEGLDGAAATAKAPKEIAASAKWAAGESTGGIDLLLAALKSIQARRKLELDDVARSMLRWFGSSPKRVPELLRASLENLRAGESHEQSGALAWEDAGRDAPHNASLVWVATPVALLHVRDTEGLADDARAFSRVTHYDPRSVGGCIAVATAISQLVRGEKDAEEAIPRASMAASSASDEVMMRLERGAAKKPDQVTVDDARGSVLATIELAFSALASAATFEEGLTAVVARGGDADVNGAVAGALLGAKFGKGQIPERWMKPVKASAELASLAEAMQKSL